MGSASVALRRITPLYISRGKITIISVLPLSQPFESVDLEVFCNLDLNQIRILKAFKDQVLNERYLGQACIFIHITEGGIWLLKVKKVFKNKNKQNNKNNFFSCTQDFTVHKEQFKQPYLLLFSIPLSPLFFFRTKLRSPQHTQYFLEYIKNVDAKYPFLYCLYLQPLPYSQFQYNF